MKRFVYDKEIQAGIIKSTGRDYCSYFFIRFRVNADKVKVACFLSSIGKDINSHHEQVLDSRRYKVEKGWGGDKTLLTVGLGVGCYELLDIDDSQIPDDIGFRRGMMNRPLATGDYNNFGVDEKHYALNKHYPGINARNGIDICICVQGDDRDKIEDRIKEVKALKWGQDICDFDNSFVEEGFLRPKEKGSFLPGRVGALGFRDGVSEDHSLAEAADHALINDPYFSIRQLRKGFILYGSYMAFRKISVDEEYFNKMVDDLAGNIVLPEFWDETIGKRELAKAMFMGRFPNGVPLVFHQMLSLDKDGETSDFNDSTLANMPFDYSHDAGGVHCPFHAHIRVMNERTSGSPRSGIVRRSFNYGPESQDTSPESRKIEGLLFTSYQKSIIDNFETLIARTSAEGAEDAIAYTPPAKRTNKEDDVPLLTGMPKKLGKGERLTCITGGGRALTEFKGGEYFFFPSIKFFEKIEPSPEELTYLDLLNA